MALVLHDVVGVRGAEIAVPAPTVPSGTTSSGPVRRALDLAVTPEQPAP